MSNPRHPALSSLRSTRTFTSTRDPSRLRIDSWPIQLPRPPQHRHFERSKPTLFLSRSLLRTRRLAQREISLDVWPTKRDLCTIAASLFSSQRLLQCISPEIPPPFSPPPTPSAPNPDSRASLQRPGLSAHRRLKNSKESKGSRKNWNIGQSGDQRNWLARDVVSLRLQSATSFELDEGMLRR